MESLNTFNITGLPKIHFGAGSFSTLPEIISGYGRRVLIFTGRESLKNSGRWESFAAGLDAARIEYKTVAVKSEPTSEFIDAVVDEYRTFKTDVVVAVGGGSVLDGGKAVSAMLAECEPVRNYLEGVGTRKPSGAKIPFIAVPTTAGTGSEATKNAVISDRKEGYKKSLRHDAYMPDVALVDPELTLGAPRYLTVACGLDAVSQLIESYTSTQANVFTDSLALKALSLAAVSLMPLSLGESNDIALRANMSYAALISGISLSHAGLGAVHGIAGPMGGLFPVPHGVACGRLLFPVMTYVIKKIIDEKNIAAQKRFADIAKVFSGDSGNTANGGRHHEDYSRDCKKFLGVLDKWTRTLKLPQLSFFGMNAAIMGKIIDLADSKNSPAVLSKEEIKVILEVVR